MVHSWDFLQFIPFISASQLYWSNESFQVGKHALPMRHTKQANHNFLISSSYYINVFQCTLGKWHCLFCLTFMSPQMPTISMCCSYWQGHGYPIQFCSPVYLVTGCCGVIKYTISWLHNDSMWRQLRQLCFSAPRWHHEMGTQEVVLWKGN